MIAARGGRVSAIVLGLALVGCATRPAEHVRLSAPGSTATGEGVVHIVAFGQGDGPRSGVVLSGAIGDYGEAVSVERNGSPDIEHRSELDLELTKGSFRIRIAVLDKELVASFGKTVPDPRTCSGEVAVSAPAPIVRGTGTGAYRGITGGFNMSLTIDEIVPRSDCAWTGAPVKQANLLTGDGAISFD